MEMRDGKHLILTGETNVFPQDEASINEINRLEKEYTELFTGKTLREKRTFTYQIIPKKDFIGKQIPICTFSSAVGIIFKMPTRNARAIFLTFSGYCSRYFPNVLDVIYCSLFGVEI